MKKILILFLILFLTFPVFSADQTVVELNTEIPSVSGGGGSGAFTTTSNVTSNSPGTLATDDFVFGSDSLVDDGNTDHDKRMLFDKSKASFFAGQTDSTRVANMGTTSAMFGYNCQANSANSLVYGYTSYIGPSADAAFAGGSSCQATANWAVSLGKANVASGTASTAIGNTNTASGSHSVAMGDSNTVSVNYGSALGQNNDVLGTHGFCAGSDNTITNAKSYGTATGYSNTAAYCAVAMGSLNVASSDYGVAIGKSNTASGLSSVAMGESCTASTTWSIAIGKNCTASGGTSLAMGESTASGNKSISIGSGTASSGTYAFSSGRFSTASGQSSVAMGEDGLSPIAGQRSFGTKKFSAQGDNQDIEFRASATIPIGDTEQLFPLDTNTNHIEIPVDTAWNITGKINCMDDGFLTGVMTAKFECDLINDDGVLTLTIIGSTTERQDSLTVDYQLLKDETNDAFKVNIINGSGVAIRANMYLQINSLTW